MNGLSLKPGRLSAQSSVIPASAKDRNQLRRMVEKDSAEEIEPRRNPVPVATKAVAVEPSVPEVTVFMDGELDNEASVPPQNSMRHVPIADGPYHNGPQRKSCGSNGPPLMFGQSGQHRSFPGQTQPLQGQQELLHRYHGPHYGPPPGQGGTSLRQNQPHQRPLYELIRQEPPPKHQGPLSVQQGPMSSQVGMHYPAPANKPNSGTKPGKVDGNVMVNDNMCAYGYPGAFNYPRATVSPHQYAAAYPPYSHQQPFYQPAQHQNLAVLSTETPYKMVASGPYFYPQQQYSVDPNWQFVFRPPTSAAQVNSRPPQKSQSILRNPLHRTPENNTDALAHSSGSTDSGMQAYDSLSLPCSPSVQPSPNTNVDIYQLYLEQKAEIEKLRQEIEGLRTEKGKQEEKTRCSDNHRQCFCETMRPVDSRPPSRCSVGVNTTRSWQADVDNMANSSKHLEESAFQNQSSNSRIQAQKCKDNQPLITSVRKDSANHSQEISPVAKRNGHHSPHQDLSFSHVLPDGADRLEFSDMQPGSRERPCAPLVSVQSCPMAKTNACNSSRSSDDQPIKSTLPNDCDGHLESKEQGLVGKESGVAAVSHSPIHGGRCSAEFESSAEQMGNFRSQDVISSSPMKCLNVDQGKNTWLSGAMIKPDAEESDVCGQTEPFGNVENGCAGRFVEKWLDNQCDYRPEYHHDNEFLMNGQTLMSMLSTYSVDQSGLDQTYLPRIEYVARAPTSRGASEMTIAADALAMKYLSDDALVRLQSSGSRRTDRLASHDMSEISMWNSHSNQMSFASREYLQKHGLLPAKSPSGKRKGRESSGTLEISTDDESEGTANGVNVAVFFQKFPNALGSRNSSQRSDAACIGSGNSAPDSQNVMLYGSRPQSNVLDRTLDLVGEVERDGRNPQNGYLDYNRQNKDRIDRPVIPSAAVPGVDLILDFNMNNFPKLL